LDLAIWLEVSEETVRDRIHRQLQMRRMWFYDESCERTVLPSSRNAPIATGDWERRNDDDLGVLANALAGVPDKDPNR